MNEENVNKKIDRVKEIITRIEKRSSKGDIKFFCDELNVKMEELRKEIQN